MYVWASVSVVLILLKSKSIEQQENSQREITLKFVNLKSPSGFQIEVNEWNSMRIKARENNRDIKSRNLIWNHNQVVSVFAPIAVTLPAFKSKCNQKKFGILFATKGVLLVDSRTHAVPSAWWITVQCGTRTMNSADGLLHFGWG